MKFYKIPFVWLIIPFILGIISIEFIEMTFLFSFFLLIIFSSFLSIAFFSTKIKTNSYIKIALVFCSFLFAGSTLMSIDSKKNNLPITSQKTTINKNYIGTIIEYSFTKSGYLKCIINCKFAENSISKSEKKLVFIQDDLTKKLKENSTILFYGKFNKIKNIGHPGEFDSEQYWATKGVYEIGFILPENVKLLKKGSQKITSPTYFRNKLTKLLKSVLSGQELALANALILGERSLLTNETTQQFSNTGAMHILAVSGLHIGILLQILLKLFQPFRKLISRNKAILLSLVILWIYAFITGFSASVIRSVVMFSLISIGSMRGKENSDLNILAFSALTILCWNPLFIYDIGFQLSYTAMLGIYLFYPYLKTIISSKYKIIQLIIEGTMVGIAAQTTTIPFTLYYFHQFPNYFILTNIALMAFSFVILLLGLFIFTFFWIPFLKLIVGIILQKTMTLMLTIVTFISNRPFATANGFSLNKLMVLLLFVTIIILYKAISRQKIKLLYIALFSGSVISIMIFQKRLINNTRSFTYKSPTFTIIKTGTTNYFLFPSYSWKSNKTKRIIKDFNNLHPGKGVLVPYEKISHN